MQAVNPKGKFSIVAKKRNTIDTDKARQKLSKTLGEYGTLTPDVSSSLTKKSLQFEQMLKTDDWNLCEGLLTIFLKGAECQKVHFNMADHEYSASSRTKSDKFGKNVKTSNDSS